MTQDADTEADGGGIMGGRLVAPWRAEDCCPLDHCNCPVGFHDDDWDDELDEDLEDG